MKKLILAFLFIATTFQFSYSQTGMEKLSDENKDFTTDWSSLTKDYMTWYEYTYYNVRLSQNFIGLDIDSNKIEKTIFLNKLLTGDIVAFNTKVLNGQPVFQLFKLNSNDESIKATIKQMAYTELSHFKMEGREIPDFNFTDLNGKTYDKTSSKGKVTVLKCWFIHCVACVKEFPDLNKLVNQNKSNPDIQFISLALDNKEDLIKFLKKKKFQYSVIPEMKNYLTDILNITEYPTHLLIDKNGIIIKVVNKIEDLIPFLQNEVVASAR